MKFDDLKTKWKNLSPTKKWLCAGIGLLVIAGLSANSGPYYAPNQNQQYSANGQPYYQGQDEDTDMQNGNYPPNAQGGQPNYGAMQEGNYPQNYQGMPNYAVAPAYGGVAPAYSGGGSPDNGMAEWEANQRRQSQSVAAFNQNIREEDTIRDTNTGQVYSGVDAGVAASAVESGSYTSVPTSELPVAGDQ